MSIFHGMNSRHALLVLSLFLGPAIVFGRPLLPMEPAFVECRGTLRLVVFPGPPNYESIKGGDKLEKVYILELDDPFDIASSEDPKKPFNDSEGWGKNVKRLQLFGDKTLVRFIGRRVTVRGKLFEGIFVHHHTSVWMDVKVTGD